MAPRWDEHLLLIPSDPLHQGSARVLSTAAVRIPDTFSSRASTKTVTLKTNRMLRTVMPKSTESL